MAAWSISAWAAAALAVLAVSAVVTWWSIAYAHRRNLIDHPGRRRSHVVATPRGGGIGIVAAVVLGNTIVFQSLSDVSERLNALALTAAMLGVAAVGWVDDHRGLSARPRLAIHCLAALLVVGLAPMILGVASGVGGAGTIGLVLLLSMAAFGVVWSINLHNFMDGIDGLLAMQALFVFCALALLCIQAEHFTEAGRIALFAAATLGFLPFNFPRSRVFMGDVGSGVLGLLIAVVIGWQITTLPIAMASGLIAASAFVVDATATLVSRILRGRRWYSAHREHLYQWLARSGRSHAQVVALYAGWNLLVVTPVLWWINRMPGAAAVAQPAQDFFVESGTRALLAVYAFAVLTWIVGKRFCLMHAPGRARGLRAQ